MAIQKNIYYKLKNISHVLWYIYMIIILIITIPHDEKISSFLISAYQLYRSLAVI
jgi:hypothetical protein